MNDDQMRQLFSPKRQQPKPAQPVRRPMGAAPMPPGTSRQRPEAYKDFRATQVFCPTCQGPSQVKERVMLYLPDGKLFEIKCTRCGTQVGTRKA